ncbi:unnamed protein product [Symbiodinium pilosum]|uniref:Uncharacterized protein n=1 Tax=Symbiodinium pilosum TaxID=2952 RepID=A0A812L821_SYMPI|nr:unnamed protein product [Symbiodinium pilosum]
MSMLRRLKTEGVFKALVPDHQGMLRINVPFAGKFEERDLLVGFLRKEVLNKRSDILFIHIYVSDVQDFFSEMTAPSKDPNIYISYVSQDGRIPLPPAQLLLGMHPDCSSRFLTDFGEPYRRYYYLWQQILYQSAMSCTQVAVFCNLWLEEAIEVQNVTRHAGMMSSAALKNEIYYGQTVTSPLTANKRDRKPFHYLVIADRAPFKVVPNIITNDEDYTGPYHNFWTLGLLKADLCKMLLRVLLPCVFTIIGIIIILCTVFMIILLIFFLHCASGAGGTNGASRASGTGRVNFPLCGFHGKRVNSCPTCPTRSTRFRTGKWGK